jgi:hypothetical protein
MKKLAWVWVVLLSACASAPQPYCIPPAVTRAPESPGGPGTLPRANSAAEDEYARCKEQEADIHLEEKLRKDEAIAKKKEAEKLEKEAQEMKEQQKDGSK